MKNAVQAEGDKQVLQTTFEQSTSLQSSARGENTAHIGVYNKHTVTVLSYGNQSVIVLYVAFGYSYKFVHETLCEKHVARMR